MGGSNTQTTKSDQTTNYQPDLTLMHEWQNVEGTVGGLTDWLTNNAPPQASVAAPTDLTSQWWQQAGQSGQGPDTSGIMGAYGDVYNNAGAMQRDPNDINLPGSFNFQP